MPRFAGIAGIAGLVLFAACLLASSPAVPSLAGREDTDKSSAAQYLTAVFDDPVSRLQKRLDHGDAHLEWYGRHGYLRAVLRELNISPASQMLAFSKTSLQRDYISPQTPRAIYFNETSYVAWERDAPFLEISTTDPRWGGTYYTLLQEKTGHPRFRRQTFDCLQCHQSSMTNDVPGPTMRSVYTWADGQPELSGGSFVTTDSSPMSERWGGWYVTGTHGHQRHMGNAFARAVNRDAAGRPLDVVLDRDAGANLTDLKERFDTEPYLSGHSDLVALMVLAHQITVHNLMTKASYLTYDALRDEKMMNEFEGKPADTPRPATADRVRSAVEPLVKALLFCGEAPLTDPVAGTSGFTREFALRAAAGPRDSQGRSLRDLDLNRRLLRYPCSYLIYSDAFDALPAPAREYVFRRIGEVIDGKDTTGAFTSLSPDDRRAIDQILRETKPDYARWRTDHH